MDNFDLKRFLVENKMTRNSLLINENQIPYDIEEFLNDMINSEVLDDLSDNVEEGDNVNGVWEIEEYGDEDAYGDAADDFKKAYQYIKDQGGQITIPGNPDVIYNAIYDGSIGYSLNVTLSEVYYDRDNPYYKKDRIIWTPEKIADFNDHSKYSDTWDDTKEYEDNIKQEADKYNTPEEFKQKNPVGYGLYHRFVTSGSIIDPFTGKFLGRTIDDIKREADKYNSFAELYLKDPDTFSRYMEAVKKRYIKNKFEDIAIFQRFKYNKGLFQYNPDTDTLINSQPLPKLSKAIASTVSKPATTQSIKYPNNNPYFGTPTTTFDKLKENQTPSEPYTYDEPSLLDFVKKHIGWIEEDVLGQHHGGYSRYYSVNDISEYEGIVFISGSKYAPTVAILNHAPTQKDLEVTGTNKDDWTLEFDRVHIPGTPKDGPMKQGVNYIKKNYYWHTRVKDEPTLKENKMQEFDLKRFLIENKMTRNSLLLNEQPEIEGIPADDPLAQIPAVPADTPSEPSGEIDKETAKQLIFDTKGKFFTVTFIKLDGSERVMNARLGVKKYLKGGVLRYNPADFNYITVYDMGSKGYRTVNANTIQKLKIGKNEYTVPTAVSESELDENAKPEDIGKGTRLLFKDDKTTYYAKNVAGDKKMVFVTKDNDDRVYKKSIAKIIQINNKKF